MKVLVLSILLIAIFLVGCATQDVGHRTSENLNYSAQNNVNKLQRIAVGNIIGRGGIELGEELISALSKDGRFKIVDRDQVKNSIKEGRLSANGLVDKNTALELGKLIGVAVLVDGRVSTYRKEETTDNYNLAGNRLLKRNGIVTVEVAFNAVDLQTGEVLLNRRIMKQVSDTKYSIPGIQRTPSRIDYNPLYFEARQAVIQEFMNAISSVEHLGDHRPEVLNGQNNDQNTQTKSTNSSLDSVEPINNNVQLNTDSPLNLSWVQNKLNNLGYDCGDVDGVLGSKTRLCIRSYQIANGLVMSGNLDDPTIEALLKTK